MTRLAFILALLAAPAYAGGPVLVDPETAPVVRDRDNALPLILLGIVVAGIVLGGGSDNCNDAPQPAPGGC